MLEGLYKTVCHFQRLFQLYKHVALYSEADPATELMCDVTKSGGGQRAAKEFMV